MFNLKKTFFILTLTFTFLIGISATALASEDTENTVQKARVISTTPLNVRDSGSTKGKALGEIPVGAVVEVLENTNGEWSVVKYGDLQGWVNPKYLLTVSGAASKEGELTGEDIIDIAMTHLGKPYVYGSTGPNSFDCSGFTQYVYKQAGISLVRTSSQQATKGTTVAKADLQAGDLVFFNSGGKSAVSHVGIYIGDGKMIHSPRTGDVVKVASLMKNFVRGKRMI